MALGIDPRRPQIQPEFQRRPSPLEATNRIDREDAQAKEEVAQATDGGSPVRDVHTLRMTRHAMLMNVMFESLRQQGSSLIFSSADLESLHTIFDAADRIANAH